MNLPQLRAFHAVALHGSVSAAAHELGVSQPAITQQVKALEEAVGSKLFRRTPSGFELTASGQDLLPKVREAVLTLDDLGARVADGRALRHGHLAVGLCAPFVAMPILERFCEHHPGIRLDLRFANSASLLDLVRSSRIDVAVATLTAPDAHLACLRLTSQEVFVLVPQGHALADRPAVTVDDLRDQPFIMREPGSMTRFLFEEGLSRAGVKVRHKLVLGSREAVKEAAAHGLGLGIVLSREVGHDPRLVALPVAGFAMEAAEYLVALPELAERGAPRAFFDAARAAFG